MQPRYHFRKSLVRRLLVIVFATLVAGGGLLGVLDAAAKSATTAVSASTAAPAEYLAAQAQQGLLQPMSPEQLPDGDSINVRHTSSLVWGDVDGDGDLDMVAGNGQYWQERFGLTVNNYDQRNQLYRNDGTGRFVPDNLSDLASALDTRSVAWGDWDGDGDLDLAVGNGGLWSGPQVNQVYENVAGTLTLSPEEEVGWVSTEAERTSSVSWGDWDGDGDLDLAVGNEDSANQVYENITGTLQLSATLGVGWTADEARTTLGVAWADWDGDGDLDLATANYGQPDRIYENITGTLQFDPVGGIGWEAAEPRLSQTLAWGDWDNDEDLDLAVGGGSRELAGGSFLIIYENDGDSLLLDPDNGFGFAIINESGSASFAKPSSLAWADWDNDDDLDLIVGNNSGGGRGSQNQIYLNDGGQTLELGWQSAEPQNYFSETTYAIAVGDADADGDLDLAVGNGGRRDGGQINLLFRNELPAIAFGQFPAWFSPDELPTTSVAWGDWDDDGDLDLAAGNDGQPNIVYENEEGKLNLDLAGELGWQATVTDVARTMAVAWADWDGDGDLDLAVGNDGSPNAVYENDNQTLILDPANGFGWQAPISDTAPTRSLAWGDWDGDGDLDLAFGAEGDFARVYENDSSSLQLDPQAGLGWQSPITMTARSVAWADWDNDDDLDLTLGARVYENVSGTDLVLDGTRGWNSNITANGVAWGDMNGDGYRDLAIALPSGRARVYENLGGVLGFSVAQKIGWQSFDVLEATGVAWGDADGDGDLDLAFSISAAEGFEPNVVFENNQGTLSARPAWTTPDTRPETGVSQKSQALAMGDADGDGDLDLAFAGYCISEDCASTGLVNEVYLNALQRRRETLPSLSVSLVNVSDPDSTAAANFYASPEVVGTNVISIPYRLASVNGTPVGQVSMYYSLDGGGRFRRAEPTAATQVTDLAASPVGTEHIFGWDTFESEFFGRSDNVVLRIVTTSAPPNRADLPSEPYRYFNAISGSFQRPSASSVTFPFRVQSTQVRVVNEAGDGIEGAVVFRLPAGQVDGALWMPEATDPQVTDADGYLPGGGTIAVNDQLIALWPVPDTLSGTVPITFTDKARLFYTSAPVGTSGPVLESFTQPDVIELVVSESNPLQLFDLVVALEWDARDDRTFLSELATSIERASEILYDVTNGQAALGQVYVYQNKELWPAADVIVKANNSIRPSAAIGGVAQVPVAETVQLSPTETKVITNAYGGGQIVMGTVWDPFGENTSELGEEWWRALAHELAHYLFFLPDNYLGFPEENILGKINCDGSFMTSTYDPAYSEFLIDEQWTGDCTDSLAAITTGRPDWPTITKMYPNLQAPPPEIVPFEGPDVLPVPVTTVIYWPSQENRTVLRARNFDVRDGDPDGNKDRLRLPAAQAYLIQTQGTPDETDDMLVQLGSPTGGGDRIKVRGAYAGDRVCLIDSSVSARYIGCVDDLQSADVTIPMQPLDAAWRPILDVQAVTSRTVAISVTQPLADGEELNVQVYPLHYWSVPDFSGLSPTATLQTSGNVHTGSLTMTLPAYDVAVRTWVEGGSPRESISHFRLNPPWPAEEGQVVTGTHSIGIGGPNAVGIGGPNAVGIGGPNAVGIGGPNAVGIGGPNAVGIGGPNAVGIGGPNAVGIGGPNAVGIGGPNAVGIGGPNAVGIGGPNAVGIGGADGRSFNAPILSADAQVVVYSKEGFFEDNGVATLQILGTVPGLDSETQTWLQPVGQAYEVTLNPEVTSDRFIAFNYLQRDVPEGYEHTLNVYFLPSGEDTWQRLDTQRFTENMVVADLQRQDGVYVIMSTIEMPLLVPGWNQFVYPLPDPRPLTDALRSISGTYSIVYKSELPGSIPGTATETNVETLEFGTAYWIWIEGAETVIPYLAPPKRSPDGYVPGS